MVCRGSLPLLAGQPARLDEGDHPLADARPLLAHAPGYVDPARLDAWLQAALNLGPESCGRPIWPGGSISGSDDGWDDSDE